MFNVLGGTLGQLDSLVRTHVLHRLRSRWTNELTNGRTGIVTHAFTFQKRPAEYERRLILLRAVNAYQCAVSSVPVPYSQLRPGR